MVAEDDDGDVVGDGVVTVGGDGVGIVLVNVI